MDFSLDDVLHLHPVTIPIAAINELSTNETKCCKTNKYVVKNLDSTFILAIRTEFSM